MKVASDDTPTEDPLNAPRPGNEPAAPTEERDPERELIVLDPAYEAGRRRVQDHRLRSLQEEDSLLACLGCANAELFESAILLGTVLRQATTSGSLSLDDLERTRDVRDDYLRLMKHVNVGVQLEMSLRGQRTGKSSRKNHRVPPSEQIANLRPTFTAMDTNLEDRPRGPEYATEALRIDPGHPYPGER